MGSKEDAAWFDTPRGELEAYECNSDAESPLQVFRREPDTHSDGARLQTPTSQMPCAHPTLMQNGVIETFITAMAASHDEEDDGEAAHWTFLPLLPVPPGDERARALVLSELACRVAVPVVLRLVGERDIARATEDLPPLWEPGVSQNDVVTRHRMAEHFFQHMRNRLIAGNDMAVSAAFLDVYPWLQNLQRNRAAAKLVDAALLAAQYPENRWGPREGIVAKCAARVFIRWSELSGQRQVAWNAAALSATAAVALAQVC